MDFDNRNAAQKAVEVLHRMEIGGRNITARDIRVILFHFVRDMKTTDLGSYWIFPSD